MKIFNLWANENGPIEFKELNYRSSAKFERYMSDPVGAEKRILISRGIDAYNVGYNTRESEIHTMIRSEMLYAEQQLEEHLLSHKRVFMRRLKDLRALEDEAKRLENDLARKKTLVSRMEEMTEAENEEDQHE